jgi:hypothetical protein
MKGVVMQPVFDELKARHREEREGYPENLSLRVHRALSWLNKAEQEENPDARFIFLWIAFNAAYATDIDERVGLSEQKTFSDFLKKLLDLDEQGRLADLVWTAYPGAIRVLLDNRYVFAPFWEFQKGNIEEVEWQEGFSKAKAAAKKALGRQDTATVLGIALSRVYTLRNQLIHGGATWQSAVNRDQIRDCVSIMGELVPKVIEIMMDHPDTLWGDVNFPVVE